jgi:anti-sigma regulatory factor (Ser/Thr protein kinase)
MEQRREYPGELEQLSDMRAFLREACVAGWGAGAEAAIAELELALSEAAANIIRHAYRGRAHGPIEMVIDVDSDAARVVLLHHGADFDPRAAAPPSFDGSREGGYGLYMIAHSVDEVRYFHDELGRVGIRLVKKRH